MRLAIIACIAASLAGCAASTPQTVTVDTFCLAAKKLKWGIADTPETIRQIDAHNRAIDIRCSSRAS